MKIKLTVNDLGKAISNFVRAAMFFITVGAVYSLYVTYSYLSGDTSLYADFITVPQQIESTVASCTIVCGGGAAAQYILSYLGK